MKAALTLLVAILLPAVSSAGSSTREKPANNSSAAEREREMRELEILREMQRREPSRSSGKYWECYKPENYVRCGVGNAP